jgi:molybdopterin converting factor small subunit
MPLASLIKAEPRLAALRRARVPLRVAVNGEFATFQKEVRDGDEVAFLPPFSGG